MELTMAEKAEKKPDAGGTGHGPANENKGKGGGLLANTPVLLGGAMLIEAAVLFAGFKFLGGSPKPASADFIDPTGTAAKPPDKKTAEVQVLDFRAPNRAGGRELLFDVSISIIVKADDEQQVKAIIADSADLIEDRVRTIIAETDPNKLLGVSEPGLDTLKRQVKYQLDDIVGDGVIQEVLIGRCIPYPADD
jgi:flagellar basal body-associated protein FliL